MMKKNKILIILSIIFILAISSFIFADVSKDTSNDIKIDKSTIYMKLLETNTYDNLLKKKGAVSIKNALYLNDERRIEYNAYGDVRGIEIYKDWNYTKNNLFNYEPSYIKCSAGMWLEVRRNELFPEESLKEKDKIYYDTHNPINTIWDTNTLIIPTEKYELAIDYKKGLGHIIAKDKINNLYKYYDKNATFDFYDENDEKNNIIIDYSFHLDTYILSDIDIRFYDENDKRRVDFTISYEPIYDDYLSKIVYNKNFIVDYNRLFDTNTERGLLYRHKYISILDEKREDEKVIKTLYLYKDDDGLLMIDDSGNKYTKDSINEKNDAYLDFAFSVNDIIKTFNNDNSKISLVDDKGYRILSAFDNGKDKVLIMAKDNTESIEYIFDGITYYIKNIKKYSHNLNKKTLIYNTDIMVGDNIEDAAHNILK